MRVLQHGHIKPKLVRCTGCGAILEYAPRELRVKRDIVFLVCPDCRKVVTPEDAEVVNDTNSEESAPSIIGHGKLRPCVVQGRMEALWHSWATIAQVLPPSPLKSGHNGGTIRMVMGIIETEDGNVCMVPAENIRFLDSTEKFRNADSGGEADV